MGFNVEWTNVSSRELECNLYDAIDFAVKGNKIAYQTLIRLKPVFDRAIDVMAQEAKNRTK